MSICNSLIIGEIEYFFVCLQNTNLDGFKLVCYNITIHDFFKLTGKLRENTKAVKSSWKYISKRATMAQQRQECPIRKKSLKRKAHPLSRNNSHNEDNHNIYYLYCSL